MKRIVLVTLLALPLAQPVLAQDVPADPAPQATPGAPGPDAAPDKGPSKMERGLQLFMDGLSDSWGDLADKAGPKVMEFFQQFGPALKEAIGKVGDLSNYEPPVVLPNGDILIKRKEGAPQYLPPVPGQREDGSVDL
ncbi:hypothetical protein KM176_12030 [Pseudooceanicola sp. CBS1P-1]|uniref:hypothetical protein n=1 Tax=Pseudooceanicola TaxID=1679449 RepID=UPI00192637EF|nr:MULTISPECIES: hypothetical protein [Pseudooceanicola]MBT9384590.1 hypothetical protein [Pseudooceanicola endophyticus]